MEKVKVIIDGSEYSLTSENNELLNKAVQIVDNEIKSTKSKYKNKLSNETMIVLSSLNIAENMLTNEYDLLSKEKSINMKLNQLVQQLENKLNWI